jgi:hypothetical protein
MADFRGRHGLPGLTRERAAETTALLRTIRTAVGDIGSGDTGSAGTSAEAHG